jgi:MATE family multidrug resistance protein
MLPLVVVLGAFPSWAVTLFVGTGPKAESLLPVATPLITLVAFFVLADGLRLIAGQALNGLSDMKAPALIAVVSFWGIGLPSGAMLGLTMELGVLGLWYGLAIGMAITAAVYLGRFRWVVYR